MESLTEKGENVFNAKNMAAELFVAKTDIAMQLHMLYLLEQEMRERSFEEEVALRMLEGVDRKITMVSGIFWMLEVYFTGEVVDEDDRHAEAARDLLLCGDEAKIELWSGGLLTVQPLAEVSLFVPESELDVYKSELTARMGELQTALSAL